MMPKEKYMFKPIDIGQYPYANPYSEVLPWNRRTKRKWWEEKVNIGKKESNSIFPFPS